MEILNVSPEHSKAVAPAVELIKMLHCEDPLVPVRQTWDPPVVQRSTGGVLSIHECGHTDGWCGEDDEAAKWEEKEGRARLEQ